MISEFSRIITSDPEQRAWLLKGVENNRHQHKGAKPCFLIFVYENFLPRGGEGGDGPMPLPLKYAIALQAVFVWIDFFDLISEY